MMLVGLNMFYQWKGLGVANMLTQPDTMLGLWFKTCANLAFLIYIIMINQIVFKCELKCSKQFFFALFFFLTNI
jgi:hypothetical protein